MELLGTLYHHCSYENLADEDSTRKDTNPQGLVSWRFGRHRIVAIAVLATISVTSASPGLAQTPSIPRCTVCLRSGDQGGQVVYIQDQLKTLGFFSATSTGYFGPLTETAVRQFQQNYGLTIDGIVGPQTQSRLDQIIYGGTTTFISTSTSSRASSPSPSGPFPSTTARPSSTIRPGQIGTELYIGSEGDQVRDVQDLLQRAGFYQGKLTGYYGSLTTSAVKEFQSSQEMEPTGITGQKTLNALINKAP